MKIELHLSWTPVGKLREPCSAQGLERCIDGKHDIARSKLHFVNRPPVDAVRDDSIAQLDR